MSLINVKLYKSYYKRINPKHKFGQDKMEIERTYAFFLDTSGSVGGSPNYWQTVWELYSLYANQVSHWYFWNSNLEPVDKKRFEQAIAERKGWNGTAPERVAEELAKKGIKNLILVTDGEVSNQSVQNCDKILNNCKLEKSICYIISTGYGELNMSVTCPFTRNCESEVYTKKKDENIQRLVKYTADDFKILDSLDDITLANFDQKYDLLESLIIALNMGKEGNIPLKNQIVVMKNRLVKELSKSMSEGDDNPGEALRIALEEHDEKKMIEIVQKINSSYFENDNTSTLEKKVSHLINLCGDLRGKYNLNEIKSNKMAIAKNALEGKLDKDVEINDLSKNPIECPIILDEDVPQILVDECAPLLLGVDKNIVDDIANCPLRILNYPEIKEKFKSRLSNYIGVKFGDKFLKNPFTQKKLLGAIPLGCHKSHVTVGNHTLAKMISGGKILGNMNLYYAVVWYLIKEGNIQYLNDVNKNAEEHLIFRLKTSKTMASLCGLAQYVTTEIPSDVAVWYCVNSGFFNQPTDRDTFRYHIFNIEPMIEICKVLKFPMLKGTEEHIRRTKAMLGMLSMVKKLDTSGKKSWKRTMQCLYQKGVKVATNKIQEKKFLEVETVVKWVPVDGPVDEKQIEEVYESISERFRKVPIEELYYLSTLADPQKSAADIFLDFNIKVPPLPKFEVNWDYELEEYKSQPIEICEKTLRPLYRIKGKLWENVALDTYKVKSVRSLFNGHKYFQEFVLKHERLPKYDELLVFYYNRYVEGGKCATLPYLTKQWTQDILDDYKEVLYEKKFDYELFKKTIEASMKLSIREAVENGEAIDFEKMAYQHKKNYEFYFGAKK